MKEYNRATNEIHAPKDLIERTKAAVKKEEQRLEAEQKKTVVFRRGLVAAAAVLAVAVITVPAMRLGMGRQTGEGDMWQAEVEGNVLLGQEKEEPETLERDRTVIEEIEEPTVYEREPEREVLLEGITVEVYQQADGTAEAEFTVDDVCYHAVNENGNIEKLLSDVEAYIRELP